MSNTEIPLIYTSRGNLPIASLTRNVRWENTEDYVKFVETYTFEDEVVIENANVLAKRLPTMAAQQFEIF
jgi:hypothetical protein